MGGQQGHRHVLQQTRRERHRTRRRVQQIGQGLSRGGPARGRPPEVPRAEARDLPVGQGLRHRHGEHHRLESTRAQQADRVRDRVHPTLEPEASAVDGPDHLGAQPGIAHDQLADAVHGHIVFPQRAEHLHLDGREGRQARAPQHLGQLLPGIDLLPAKQSEHGCS
jgi:hypothetical protein